MKNIKFTKEEFLKLTKKEKRDMEIIINMAVMLFFTSSIGGLIFVISLIANFIFDNNLTLFMSISLLFLELCSIGALLFVQIDCNKKILKLKKELELRN